MPTPLPREPSGSTPLHQTIKQLIRCLRERTLLGSTDYGLEHHAEGVFLRFKQETRQVQGGGEGMKNRGTWSTFVHYEEGDVVYVRDGLGGPESQGTFICIREHDSSELNYPRERTQEGVDPGAGGPDDIWRTLAAGAWDKLKVKGFPVPVVGGPSTDLPAMTDIEGGTIGCSSPGGFAGLDGLTGAASALAGASQGRWEFKCVDLPANEIVKFRLMTLCIGNEKFTAYVAMSEPKPVP